MSKAAKAAPALPRKEYKLEKILVQGRRVEPVELIVGEMMSGDLADCAKQFFEILGRMVASDGAEKLAGPETLTNMDLMGALADAGVDAAMEIAARSAEVPVSFLRQIDGEDLEKVTTAAFNANRPFFVTLLARFGLSMDMFKSPAALLTPKAAES